MERNVKLHLIPTGKENEFIEVSVYYDKGGMNYFTSRTDPRGYWISVSRITKGANWVRRTLFEGRKMFLLEAKRFSQKGMNNAINIGEGTYKKMVKNVYGIDVD